MYSQWSDPDPVYVFSMVGSRSGLCILNGRVRFKTHGPAIQGSDAITWHLLENKTHGKNTLFMVTDTYTV
jgi:hypothetical protein